MRKAIIDIETGRILEFEGKVLEGECLRCGKCCIGCEFLVQDSFRDAAMTMPIYSCKIHYLKFCLVRPLPKDDMPVGCGFKWKDK